MIRYLIIISLILCSCNHSQPEDYMIYFNDQSNGLIDVYETTDWQYTVQFRSPEYMALIETRNREINHDDFNSIKDEYGDYDYFLFKIRSKKNGSTKSLLSENQLLEYEVDWKEGFLLLNEYDSIKPLMIHCENLLGVSGELRFITAYDRFNELNRKFIIPEFAQDSNVELSILNKHIINIPELVL